MKIDHDENSIYYQFGYNKCSGFAFIFFLPKLASWAKITKTKH